MQDNRKAAEIKEIAGAGEEAGQEEAQRGFGTSPTPRTHGRRHGRDGAGKFKSVLDPQGKTCSLSVASANG
jgi:hypothetical protein